MLVAVLGGAAAAGCCTMVDSPIVLCSSWWTSGRTGHTRTMFWGLLPAEGHECFLSNLQTC